MYEREFTIPAPSRGGRRVSRRRRRFPWPGVLTAAVFLTAAAVLPRADPPAQDGGTVYPVLAQASARSEEPVPPDPDKQDGAWQLTLVNPWNALPQDYTFTLHRLSNGLSVDERCYPALEAMLSACREEGLQPVVCSAYRTWEKQEELFQNKIRRLQAQGVPADEAQAEAGKTVAVPGTSEHQLGLAVDLVDYSNQNLDSSQEDTAVQQWLMEHSWEYGFILRYPNDKSDITGIIYEPWHYRYVGETAAAEIHAQGICLEEYLAGEK